MSTATTAIEGALGRLLAFEPTTLPVISLYLNTEPNKHGRDDFDQFVRKELRARSRTFSPGSPERDSFDRDTERITTWLDEDLEPSANGVALFACAGSGEFFEALQLNAPVPEHRLYIYNQPHLYHLAMLDDQYPRYAALVTDANSARIFVFGLGETLGSAEVNGKKVHRVKVGGWSQARYQRRVENAHRDHAREAVDMLDRVVREDGAAHVILAGDANIVSVVQEQLPKHLAGKLVDVLRLDTKAPEHEILETTLESLRKQDAATDAEKVQRALEMWRAGGLAVAGPQDTLEALANGQVDELLLSGELERSHPEEEPVEAILAPEIPASDGGTDGEEPRSVSMPDLLVTKAKQTAARVTFIEDAALLEPVEGVAGFLRWR